LADVLQGYLHEQQAVTDDGVHIPNVFRSALGTRATAGSAPSPSSPLPRDLGTVAVEPAAEQSWMLLGP
jgi:hypothetical protein